MVIIPKTRKTYCAECATHTVHRATYYKKAKERKLAQGLRRANNKKSSYGGTTKPLFKKKAKETKKLTLSL
ncbi:UNVERIFIED_CONTAM: hypothetical protein GTU68_051734 [Idotea baltica]|nr:hypothetical protein [Idotea baltica]